MRLLLLLAALLALAPSARAQTDPARSLDVVLQTVVEPDGSVCYSALTDGPARHALNAALKDIRDADPTALRTDADKLAFWANAYNALMLDAVSRRPGRANVLGDDDGAAFFRTPMRAAGLSLTLDELENVILRRQPTERAELRRLRVDAVDPRLHVALNCAAVSCPPLPRRAFRAATLDRTLDRAFAVWVNDPAHFRVENGTLVASSLIDWFGSDFDQDQPAGDLLLAYMAQRRPDYAQLRTLLAGNTSADLKAAGTRYAYDWTVHRARRCR
jgi:hypothetical protein